MKKLFIVIIFLQLSLSSVGQKKTPEGHWLLQYLATFEDSVNGKIKHKEFIDKEFADTNYRYASVDASKKTVYAHTPCNHITLYEYFITSENKIGAKGGRRTEKYCIDIRSSYWENMIGRGWDTPYFTASKDTLKLYIDQKDMKGILVYSRLKKKFQEE